MSEEVKRTSNGANPGSYLKKRREHQLKTKAEARRERQAKSKKVKYGGGTFVRAERFVAYARSASRSDLRVKRANAALSNPSSRTPASVPESSAVIAVVRVKTRYHVSPKVQAALASFGLVAPNVLALVPASPENARVLASLSSFITWGAPSHKTVSDLLHKRGYANILGRKVPLTGNQMIEEALGKHGVICIEDIVHELFTAGPAAGQVRDFLWPFRLNSPPKGWKDVEKPFSAGGETGDRKEEINKLIVSMC